MLLSPFAPQTRLTPSMGATDTSAPRSEGVPLPTGGYRDGGRTGSVTGAGAVGGSVPLSGLSPEELLLWVQSRLEGFDAEIRQLMSETGAARNRASALQGMASEVGSLAAAGSKEDKKALIERIRATCDDPAIRETCENMLRSHGDGAFSKGQMSALESQLTSAASAITSSTDLMAMRLQSLVSARGQAVQVASSILHSLNDSAKQVIANLR